MPSRRNITLDIPSAELHERLVADPLPLGLGAPVARRGFYRDVFFDTPDDALAARGVRCRMRLGADDRRWLTLIVAGSDLASGARRERFDARIDEVESWRALTGGSEPARRLRGIVDAAQLEPRVQIEVARASRSVANGFPRRKRAELLYDAASVRGGELSRTFFELIVRDMGDGRLAERLSSALIEKHLLTVSSADRYARARLLLKWIQDEADARAVGAPRMIALVALAGGGGGGGRIACEMNEADGGVRLPTIEGSGEAICAPFARRLFGETRLPPTLLGTVPPRGGRPLLEVWCLPLGATREGFNDSGGLSWLPLEEAMARAGSPVLLNGITLSALTVLARSTLLQERRRSPRGVVPRSMGVIGAGREALWGRGGSEVGVAGEGRAPPDSGAYRHGSVLNVGDAATAPNGQGLESVIGASGASGIRYLNGELSQLEFHGRVLELAEDSRIPLLERVRFLSIVSANLDEFFMVRVGGLKSASAEIADEDSMAGLTPVQQLEAIALRIPVLVARQQDCLAALRPELAKHGVRILTWLELEPHRREELRSFFREEIFSALTPLAMTLSAGHPFPEAANLALSLAVTVQDLRAGSLHFAHVEIPPGTRRFVPVGSTHDFVPIEEVIKANLDLLFPDSRIERAHAYRVTRGGLIGLARPRSGGVGAGGRKAKLLEAMEVATLQRPSNAVVRIEVEHAMPEAVREMVVKELRPPASTDGVPPVTPDVYAVDGLLNSGDLKELADLPLSSLRFSPFVSSDPFADSASLWDVLRDRDVLVHHPYEDFSSSVVRFFSDAADDPEVVAIKTTLYRAGKRAPIVDALTRAAARGAEVAVFVELKARFDEERNVRWAKTLEKAGIHVVYGLSGLKTHAKVALVVRREERKLRRYVHVGTGNYNADTARLYTDLGLLSSDAELGADIADLFNELTGSSRAPGRTSRRCLVAPTHLLPGLLSRIQREADHARAGSDARIRVKLNGLSDEEVIEALYAASRAGVRIDLLVRGICTLRPGVPDLSQNIRVRSCLGRFLEHARIYHFGNAGAPEYFIASADWRRRNLRRRVEVAAEVRDADCRSRLDELLTLELADPLAWELRADGSYVRREGDAGAMTAQQTLLNAAASPKHPAGTHQSTPA